MSCGDKAKSGTVLKPVIPRPLSGQGPIFAEFSLHLLSYKNDKKWNHVFQNVPYAGKQFFLVRSPGNGKKHFDESAIFKRIALRRGLIAIEVKRSIKPRSDDLDSLELFKNDYPMARCIFAYGGGRTFSQKDIECIPYEDLIRYLPDYL